MAFSITVDSNEGELLPSMVHAEEKVRLEVGDVLIKDNDDQAIYTEKIKQDNEFTN